jgi:hypothetical protein
MTAEERSSTEARSEQNWANKKRRNEAELRAGVV